MAIRRTIGATARTIPQTGPARTGSVYFSRVTLATPWPVCAYHALILVSSLLMLAVVLALVHAHRPRISQLDFSLLIIVTVLASYHAYTHDLVLLLIPIFIVANHVGREAFSQFRLALGMCAGLLLILPSLLPPPAVTVLAVLLFFALLLKESLSEGLALRAPLRETSLTPPSVVSLGNQRAS